MSDPLFYDEQPRQNSGLRNKIRSLNPLVLSMLSLGTLVIIVFSIWAFYPGEEISEDSLPIIRASSEPVRVKPEATDLTETAGYNSRIYETFGQPQEPRRIENLLKPQQNAEVPVEKEELFAGLNSNIDNKKSKVISITESPFSNEPSEAELEISETEEPSLTTSVKKPDESETSQPGEKISVDIFEPEKTHSNPGIFAENTPIEEPEETKQAEEMDKTEPAAGVMAKAADITPPVPKADPAGTHYVQLASIQDSSKTVDAWKKLTEKHSGLQNISFRTQSADIEGKGTFYRIQAGPLSKADADKLCAQIKADSGSCFVISK